MDIEEAKEDFKSSIAMTLHGGKHTIVSILAIKTVLAELEEYEKALDIFDEREYRKKYLEEERAIRPNLLYPDADEIYQKYFQQRTELEKKNKVINEMAECIGQDIRCVRPEIECNKMTHDCTECVKQYYFNKVEREGK